MILAARQAGDLAEQGQRPDRVDVDTLDVYGISRDLAADAVLLAQVPHHIWREPCRRKGRAGFPGPVPGPAA